MRDRAHRDKGRARLAHGYVIDGPISVGTDNKGAYDLCHRYTSAQHSRHIDRKLYKMREMRGKGLVNVRYVPTDDNTAVAPTNSRRC